MPKIKKNIYVDKFSFQTRIIDEMNKGEVLNITEIIPLLTPGTELRKAIDEILNGNLGALIVLGTNDFLKDIMKGGFELNLDFYPSKLFELSKMDGAIVLSNDLKKIIAANIHLNPDKDIPSSETGIRHRSAEQTAKQTNLPVVSISQRRNTISLYYREQKYILQDIHLLIIRANHSINNLKDNRVVINNLLNNLSHAELLSSMSIQTLFMETVQKILYFFKYSEEIDNLLVELGDQGVDVIQSLYETTYDLTDIFAMLLQDYSDEPLTYTEAFSLAENLKKISIRKIMNTEQLKEILGIKKLFDTSIKDYFEQYPRGYRILSKIPNLKVETINRIVFVKKSLSSILNSNVENLHKACKITKEQAKYIQNNLEKYLNSMDLNMF